MFGTLRTKFHRPKPIPIHVEVIYLSLWGVCLVVFSTKVNLQREDEEHNPFHSYPWMTSAM